MSLNIQQICNTLNNISFHVKTITMGALPLMMTQFYIYNKFVGDAWKEQLALVAYAPLMPPLALAHLLCLNQVACSAAFLFAFLGLREECPGGDMNHIPTIWSMLWFKTMGLYMTQVALYFAWPLMLWNGSGHTGWSFFGVSAGVWFFGPVIF